MKDTNLELEDFTMELFKKSVLSKTLSNISKVLMLVGFPVLLIFCKFMQSSELFYYWATMLFVAGIWVFSTRQYNHLNIKIKMNLWLLDMIKNPEQFHAFVAEKGIK